MEVADLSIFSVLPEINAFRVIRDTVIGGCPALPFSGCPALPQRGLRRVRGQLPPHPARHERAADARRHGRYRRRVFERTKGPSVGQ
jgi:hypothetical protein